VNYALLKIAALEGENSYEKESKSTTFIEKKIYIYIKDIYIYIYIYIERERERGGRGKKKRKKYRPELARGISRFIVRVRNAYHYNLCV
jgi:hypothetical protein